MTHADPPAFDHLAPGTAAAAWTPIIEATPPLTPPGADDHLVVVVAHPDDESLGAGGLIATASRSGARVTVVVATDGEASHPGSRTHSAELLARLRREEVAAAVAALAADADVRRPGLPDGQLAGHVAELRAVLGTVERPTHVVTTWLDDGHPDHAACAVAGAELAAATQAQHWQFPIWGWRLGRPDGPAGEQLAREHHLAGLRLDEQAWTAKRRALACYTSQHQPLSPEPGDEPILDDAMLEHFRRRVEPFLLPSVSAAHFTELYATARDPWLLEARYYEQRKRGMLLAALPRRRFGRAFEPGCATGLLTEQLALRCDELIAWDVVPAAVEQTADRLAGRRHVTVAAGAIPEQWPDGSFDLIVLSEVGYYCRDLAQLVARAESALTPDGVLVACHWQHPAPLHPHTAAQVHAAVDASSLHKIVAHSEADFLLDVWSRDGRSVAAAEGIVA